MSVIKSPLKIPSRTREMIQSIKSPPSSEFHAREFIKSPLWLSSRAREYVQVEKSAAGQNVTGARSLKCR